MKKTMLYVSLACVLFVSCKKEQILNPKQAQDNFENKETTQNILDKSLGTLRKIEKLNGIYHFESEQELIEVLEELENMDLNYKANFYKANQHLTDDELIEKIEAINWNENQVLDNLDKANKFRSLRADIQEKEDVWREVDGENYENHPDKFVITDSYYRSLLTVDKELIVGSSIYLFMDEDNFIKIKNLNFDVLNKIKSGEISKGNAPEFVMNISNGVEIIWNASGIENCYGNKATKWIAETDGDYRIECRVSVNNALGYHNLKAETKSLKKNKKGKWKKNKENISATVYAEHLRFPDCGWWNLEPYEYKDGHKKEVTAKYTVGSAFRIRSEEVRSYHTGPNNTKSLTLTF